MRKTAVQGERGVESHASKKKLEKDTPYLPDRRQKYEKELYVLEEQQLTVNVKVRLLGVFRGLSGKSELSLRFERATVRDVILTLTDSLSAEARRLLIDAELNDPRPNALILLNGKEINVLSGLQTQIEEGDEVTLIPVSHGG